jgi:hypothetical protein
LKAPDEPQITFSTKFKAYTADPSASFIRLRRDHAV